MPNALPSVLMATLYSL